MHVIINDLKGVAIFSTPFVLCLLDLMALLSALLSYLAGAYSNWSGACENLTSLEIHLAIQVERNVLTCTKN